MNIDYSEINNLEQHEQYENYWDNPNTMNPNSFNNESKQPKITYNDILSSLNVVVQNGILQKINIPKSQHQQQNQRQNLKPQQQQQQQQQYQKKQVKFNPRQQTNQIQQPTQIQQTKKIEPQLKNSYIFNKYFKNYKDENVVEEEPQIPLTKEEYKKMLIDNYIKRIQEKKRIAQIKSKKIQYTNTDNFIIKPSYNNANLNRLFRI